MSKKGKNKIKKIQKAKIIQESIVTESSTIQTSKQSGSQDIMANVLNKKNKNVIVPKDNLLPETAYVKYEMKKIAVVFGLILILLIGITIADSKMNIIVKLADKIMKLF